VARVDEFQEVLGLLARRRPGGRPPDSAGDDEPSVAR
jgi:hypothetical protein